MIDENEEQKLVEGLKRKHSTSVIWRVDIPLDGEEVTLYLKKLDRVTYLAATKVLQTDELQATEIFLKNLTVHGNEKLPQIINELDSLRAAQATLLEVLSVKEAGIKKL